MWSLDTNVNFVNKEAIKMTKSVRKKTRGTMPAKGAKRAKRAPKTANGQTKAAEYVNCLLELHKLQGILLTRLRSEI
jgi:hypothetical protein